MTVRRITNQVAVDTAIMASGDVIASAIIEFKNAVPLGQTNADVWRLSIVSPDAVTAANMACELWLFNATVTAAAANAAHVLSDGDAQLIEAIISIAATDVFINANNSIAMKVVDVPVSVTGTSVFGILVTRATPTFTGGTIQVSLWVDS